jgi:glutathione S-transferase
MMILYFSPGACSLADHIALHEAGMTFDLAKVDLKTHKLDDGRDFTEVNPKGYVPALQLDNGDVLTENVAILSMIAEAHPALMAPGSLGRSRLLEMLAFISTEIHKSFKPLFSPDATDADKSKAVGLIAKKLTFIATQLKGPYLFGETPTVADSYLFVMLTWAAKNGVAIPASLTQFSDRMRSRPAVQAALKHEGLG